MAASRSASAAAARVPSPMVRRYRELPAARARRLALAAQLAVDPRPLVRDLADSVSAPPPAPPRWFPGAARSPVRELAPVRDGERPAHAADFAFWLAREGRLSVAGEPLLDCEYVDQELAIGGQPRSLRLDLLLVNAYDRLPVLGEVKLGADKDPFAALVQVLACTALLAGPGQRERLRRGYPQARFADGTDGGSPAPVDAIVLLVEPRWRAAMWTELLSAAREIARAVTSQAATHVRRITFLHVGRSAGRLWVDAERL